MTDINQRDTNNNKTGYWEWYYYSNGKLLWRKGNYTNNKETGYWEIYNPNGNIETKIFFI
jgi:antitoxin component YwqK of YwqJK toxin-antitoxin module